MPKAMELKLKAIARKRGYGKKRTGAFVYGPMRNIGWKPGNGENSKMRNPQHPALHRKK